MTSAMIQVREIRDRGRKVVEIVIPRRIFTALRAMRPDSVKLKFSNTEAFEIGASELGRAIKETYSKKKRGR